MNVISNKPTTALVSPITPSDFASFMGLEYNAADDALLNGFILTSCEICISYTSNELLQRTWEYRADGMPTQRDYFQGVVSIPAIYQPWIDLPINGVTSITSVAINDVAYTGFTTDFNSTPQRVELGTLGKILITYVAGSATAAAIDSRLILGIKMLATYLFDNRGCDTMEAISKSGAKAVWQSKIMYTGGL